MVSLQSFQSQRYLAISYVSLCAMMFPLKFIDETEPGHMYEEVQLPETCEPMHSAMNPLNISCRHDVKMNNNECYDIINKTFQVNDCPAYEL